MELTGFILYCDQTLKCYICLINGVKGGGGGGGWGGKVSGWGLHSSLDYRGRLGDTTIHCVVTAVDHIGVQVDYTLEQCIAWKSRALQYWAFCHREVQCNADSKIRPATRAYF